MTDVDQKYDPDDDSSDEEAIRVRHEREAKRRAAEEAEAERQSALKEAKAPGKKK